MSFAETGSGKGKFELDSFQAVRSEEIRFKTLVIDPTRQVDKQIWSWGG